MISQVLPALICATVLAGCANAVKPDQLPQMRIVDVQVTSNANVLAHSDIASKVAASSRAAAAAYNAYMPANAPARVVKINIDRVHYKNPLASLLIGDAHRMSGVVAGGVSQSASVTYVDAGSGVINGVAGAVIAAATDKANVDTRLAHGLAGVALAKAYGQNSVPSFISKHMSGNPTHYQRTQAPTSQQAPAAAPSQRRYESPVVEEDYNEQMVMADPVSATNAQPVYRGPTAPSSN